MHLILYLWQIKYLPCFLDFLKPKINRTSWVKPGTFPQFEKPQWIPRCMIGHPVAVMQLEIAVGMRKFPATKVTYWTFNSIACRSWQLTMLVHLSTLHMSEMLRYWSEGVANFPMAWHSSFYLLRWWWNATKDSWDVVLGEADLLHLLFVLTQGTLIVHLAGELADS